MSTFKHGDRVWLDRSTGHQGTVVGYSTIIHDRVIVECCPPAGSMYTVTRDASQLQRVATRPEVGRPWIVYGSDGRLMAGFDALEKAKQYARVYRGTAIVDVRAGEWLDTEGERIP